MNGEEWRFDGKIEAAGMWSRLISKKKMCNCLIR
jgi:hypothetical protein